MSWLLSEMSSISRKNTIIKSRPRNILVESRQAVRQSISVAVNNNLSINYPNVKQSRSGRVYIEHKDVPRQSAHPFCSCHERTYLFPFDFYFECVVCKETHYFSCHESPFERESEINCDEDDHKCVNCLAKLRSRQ